MILRKVVAGSPWFFRVNVMFMVWFVCLFFFIHIPYVCMCYKLMIFHENEIKLFWPSNP